MRNILIAMTMVVIGGFLAAGNAFAANAQPKGSKKGNILVVYFSHSGNTRYLAEQIHSRVGGDMLEIKAVQPYSSDYNTVVEQAKREKNTNARPKLAVRIPNLKPYDLVFVGYPSWWGTMPMAMFTFFEGNSLAGKTLIPFTTHEGSRFGQSVSDLKRLNPRSTILDGLAIRGRSVKNSSTQKEISQWLNRLNLPGNSRK